MHVVDRRHLLDWNRTWALAVVFGLASVPWTYGLVAGLDLPLWPSFLASATFYAAGEGLEALGDTLASTGAGVVYAVATLAIVDGAFGGGVLVLSLVVGLFMFLASLHAAVPVLSFTPGGFVGYATLFSVHAAGATAFGVTGLAGVTLATVVSMAVGVLVGLGTAEASRALASE